MIPTGKHANEETKTKILSAIKEAQNAPVLTVRSDLPTLAESAWERVYVMIHQAALDAGCNQLVDSNARYAVRTDTWEFVVPDGA
jgi:GTP:adenosylcobinamide-phosphate guanylyltransferase